MSFSYLLDQRDIIFEVVGSFVMQKVFTQFATIFYCPDVASMVVESNIIILSHFSLCIVVFRFCILSYKLPMLNDTLICGIS